jgi:hypothetical protein
MRLSQPELLSLAVWHTVRLLTEESSISVCLACKSSEAEITGNSRTSRHPRDARHWSELNLRVPRRHSQYAGSASSSHARLSSSSIQFLISGFSGTLHSKGANNAPRDKGVHLVFQRSQSQVNP